MKKLILLSILFFALLFSLKATVLTVDNNPNSAADFTALQEAIDAATSGDTIYVAGSSNSYGNITISKHINLIGEGFASIDQSRRATILSEITLDDSVDDPSDLILEGFDFVDLNIPANRVIENVTIRRCKFIRIVTTSNGRTANSKNDWKIYNNIITGDFSSSELNRLIFANNILLGGGTTLSNSGTIITNNIFYNTIPRASLIVLRGDNQLYFNNVLIGYDFGDLDEPINLLSNSTIRNNLSFTTAANGLAPRPLVFGSNVGSGNFENVDPQFVGDALNSDFTAGNGVGEATFFATSLNLSNSSPGKNAGTDGSDIGIYVGPFPWPEGPDDFPNVISPTIPQVIDLTINNPSLQGSGTLSVEATGTIRN